MTDIDPTDETPHYELLVPFTIVASVGGQFADDDFTAGFEMGKLWQELAMLINQRQRLDVHLIRTVRTVLVDQVQLFAMHYGLDCILLADCSDHEWSTVTFG